ncbi:uncharacterized protein METZ01_LOCUS189351 [marine metagenome]|uniref:Uncharacterized protein n=1 Tax=marine metagenome TaxID=408172 RepID=A0A382DFU9_9ZZZZ
MPPLSIYQQIVKFLLLIPLKNEADLQS